MAVDDPREAIRALARQAAAGGLRYRQAVWLCDVVVVADHLVASGGNEVRAAVSAGVDRATVCRRVPGPMVPGPCRGFRSRRGKPCLVCEGTGWVTGPAVSTPRGAFFSREPCPECLGRGVG